MQQTSINKGPAKRKVSVKGLGEAIVMLAGIATLVGFFGRFHWVMDLASHFRLHYAIVLGIGALAMWIGKARKQAIAAIIACLINVLVIAEATWQSGRPGGETILRVLSANLHTQNRDRQSIQRLVRERDPDVLVLAEVDESWVLDLRQLRQQYPYGMTEARDDNFGIALWSKLSLVSTQVFFTGSEELPTIRAILNTPRGNVAVWGTHPLPPSSKENTEARNTQLRELISALEKEELPALLVGDLNTTPWNHAFRQLTRGRMSSAIRWYQATWPSLVQPIGIPLDHCLYSEELQIRKMEVCRSIGSDHRPIYAEIAESTPTPQKRVHP